MSHRLALFVLTFIIGGCLVTLGIDVDRSTLNVAPTPTQEIGCVVLTQARLNERLDHSLSAPVRNVLPLGTSLLLDDFVEAEGYLWGRTPYGWVALRNPASKWWVSVESGVCPF